MEVCLTVNRLLDADVGGRTRKLRLRTYAVTCLNEETGLIEWMPRSTGFRYVVSDTYTRNGVSPVLKLTMEVKEQFEKLQKEYVSCAFIYFHLAILHSPFYL